VTELEERVLALEEAVDEIADDHEEFDRRFLQLERTLQELLRVVYDIRAAVQLLTADRGPGRE
jgi:hypothetical protein